MNNSNDETTVHPHIREVNDITVEAEAKRQRAKSHKRLAVAFSLLIVLLAATVAFVSYGAELWGGHTIPSVRNEKVDKAKKQLSDLGFKVNEKTKVTDTGVGLVVKQTPPAGERHAKGTEVTIWVGEARVIPEVLGMKLEDAQQKLKDAGANNIKVLRQPSTKEEGKVLAVEPKAGTAFTSDQEIRLTVATARTLPDLVGKTEQQAMKALDDMGIAYKKNYVKSDKDGHSVVATEPKAGSEIEENTEVILSVSYPYPSGIKQFAEYFRHRPSDVAEFLGKQGFAYKGGYIDARGDAQALYSNGQSNLRLCSNPFDHNFDASGSKDGGHGEAGGVNKSHVSKGDVVSGGADFSGVRYEYASSEIPSSAKSLGSDAIYAVMSECGLSSASASCTEDTITLPSKAKDLPKKDGRKFSCMSGTEGDYTWTVLIAQVKKDSDEVRVVVTYAPTSLYGDYDISGNGGNICDFAAYVDMYA